MLTFKAIELKPFYPGYGRGATPGYKCSVTLQHGDRSFDTIEVELSPDAVRDVIACAVAKAMESFKIDLETLDVSGSAGDPQPDEAPTPPDMMTEPMVISADDAAPEMETL